MNRPDPNYTAKVGNEVSDTMADAVFSLDSSVVITKFDPGPQRTHLISRARLIMDLDDHIDARLTLITAPAGYGKTTLLAEWRDQLRQRGVVAAWLSLDKDDNDTGLVMHCILQALVRGGLKGVKRIASSPVTDIVSRKQHLTALLNIISHQKHKVVLVLDEFEHMPADIADEIILPLLEKGPANFQIVIASREAPELKIASLRPQGLVHDINARDMRFNLREIRSLFGDKVSKGELQRLESHTSGWPVAIQLLKGVWNRQDQRCHVLQNIEALDATLIDYLSEQVFSSLPEEIFNILVRVSPVDRLSLEVTKFMTGSEDSWLKIKNTCTLAPFLVPVDSGQKIYRTHPVIRAYFRTCLDALPAAQRVDVYQKAAHWYASQNRLVSALSFARSADDLEFAGTMVEKAGGFTIWLRSGLPRLKAIVDILDPDVYTKFPRIKLLKAFLLVKMGNVRESRRIFEEVRKDTRNFEQDRDNASPQALRLDSLMLESTLLVNEGRASSDSYLEQYEQTMRRISENDDVFLGNVKILLAISHNQRGYFEKALNETSEAIGHYRRARLFHGEFFAFLHKGTSMFALGRSREAREIYANVRHMCRTSLDGEKTKMALFKAQNGELEYECTHEQPSIRVLGDIMAILEECEWWYDIFAAAALPLIMTLLVTRDLEAAIAELNNCRAIVEKHQANGLCPLFDALEVSCLALAGNIDLARMKLDEFGFSPDSLSNCDKGEVTWRQIEAVASAIARVYIRDSREQCAIDFLDPLVAHYRERGHIRTLIRLGVLKAIAEDLAGLDDKCRSSLIEITGHVTATGYIRPFIEESRLARKMLATHRDALGEVDDATDFLAIMDSQILSPRGADSEQVRSLLTGREHEVICEVAEGLTDKEIARKLDLAPNTVKFHLKNIFRKLGVRNRAHAVSESRNKGIISHT